MISKQDIDDFRREIELHVALRDNGRRDVNNDVALADSDCKHVLINARYFLNMHCLYVKYFTNTLTLEVWINIIIEIYAH